ncbi:MAG: helix-turn-helix transcriptional regulator [Rhizomicrobium sp.]
MRKTKTTKKIAAWPSSGDVFIDMGFTSAEAEELNAKGALIRAIDDTIRLRKLTQIEAARLCETDQPTLSKVLRGRVESITIDRLAYWLRALGRTVEIKIRPYSATAKTGQLLTVS